jgi:hypothetical protein
MRPIRLQVREQMLEPFHCVILTSKTYNKYCPSIWVQRQISENPPSRLLVFTKLRTTIRMSQRMDTVDTATCKFTVRPMCESLRQLIHTTDSRNNPNLIAHADLTVSPTIRLDCNRLLFLHRRNVNIVWVIMVLDSLALSRHEIVHVDVTPGSDRALRPANRKPVFDNRLSRRDVASRDLVTRRNIVENLQILTKNVKTFVLLDRTKSNNNSVPWVDVSHCLKHSSE